MPWERRKPHAVHGKRTGSGIRADDAAAAVKEKSGSSVLPWKRPSGVLREGGKEAGRSLSEAAGRLVPADGGQPAVGGSPAGGEQNGYRFCRHPSEGYQHRGLCPVPCRAGHLRGNPVYRSGGTGGQEAGVRQDVPPHLPGDGNGTDDPVAEREIVVCLFLEEVFFGSAVSILFLSLIQVSARRNK